MPLPAPTAAAAAAGFNPAAPGVQGTVCDSCQLLGEEDRPAHIGVPGVVVGAVAADMPGVLGVFGVPAGTFQILPEDFCAASAGPKGLFALSGVCGVRLYVDAAAAAAGDAWSPVGVVA